MRTFALAAAALALAAIVTANIDREQSSPLLNASYDPTRKLFAENGIFDAIYTSKDKL